jgi:hypothetical protein
MPPPAIPPVRLELFISSTAHNIRDARLMANMDAGIMPVREGDRLGVMED